MKAIAFFLVMIFGLTRLAAADPWYVYGQTPLPLGVAIDNPAPNSNGLIGEVDSLPYTVPPGCTLTINAYGIESYVPSVGLFIWLGLGSASNDNALMTVLGNWGTAEIIGSRFVIPSGEIVNIRIMNGSPRNGWTHAWYLNGDLNCRGL